MHVDDVCRGINTVVNRGELNTIYNIGSGQMTSLGGIMSTAKHFLKSESNILSKPGYSQDMLLDCGKVRALGFSPKISITEIIRELCTKRDTFIESAKEMDDDIFPFMANKDWEEGKPVYYSGPYWDDNEARELIYSVMKGKWLSSGEKVNRFEHEFSSKFGFSHSVMVNSGSSANLVMVAALKKYFNWADGDEIIVCACGFATTVAPIVQAGLKPVFVDINWGDLNWDYGAG